MDNFLDTSISGIRQRLEEAARKENIGQAKYAIGLLAGLLVSAAPGEQRYILLKSGGSLRRQPGSPGHPWGWLLATQPRQ